MLSPGQNTPFLHAAMVTSDEASGSQGAEDDDEDDASDISAHLPSIARIIKRLETGEKKTVERSRVDNAADPVAGPERIDMTNEESPGRDNQAHAIPVAGTPVGMVSSPSWGASSASVEGHRGVINGPPSGPNGGVPLLAPFRPSATRTSDNRPAQRRHRASTAPGVAATSDELVATAKRRKGETSGGVGRGAQPALHPAPRLRTRAPGQENKDESCATPMTLAAGSQPSVAPAPRRCRGARVQASKPSPAKGSTEVLGSGNADEGNDIYTVKRLLARWGRWYLVAWEDSSTSWEPKRNMLNQKMVDDFEDTYEGLHAGVDIGVSRIWKGRKQWRVHWHGRPTKEDCWIDDRRIDWARIGRN